MRKRLNKIIKKWGYQLCRTRDTNSVTNEKSEYEYLKNIPRYTEQTVQLLGDDFKIADSLSFYHSVKEIFDDHIYKFETESTDPVILDCGANYGSSAVYFKQLHPQSSLTCVEADPSIFKILETNLTQRGYDDIRLINRAVSNDSEAIKFHQEGADAGRAAAIEDGENTIEVPTIHLDDLIDGPVDFLKMDIEGCETEAICSSSKLDQVSQIFIEYHSFKNSEQSLSKLLGKLTECGFRYYIHTQFCSPRPLTEETLQLGMDLQLNIFALREDNNQLKY